MNTPKEYNISTGKKAITAQIVQNTHIKNLKYALAYTSGISRNEKDFKTIEAALIKWGHPSFTALRVSGFSKSQAINNFKRFVRIDSSDKKQTFEKLLRKINGYAENQYISLSEADLFEATYDNQLIYEYGTTDFTMENIFAQLLNNKEIKKLTKKSGYEDSQEFETLYDICHIKLPYLQKTDLVSLCEYIRRPDKNADFLRDAVKTARKEYRRVMENFQELVKIKINPKLKEFKGNLALSLVEYKFNLAYPDNNLFLNRLFNHFPVSKQIPFLKLNITEPDNKYYYKTDPSLKQENQTIVQEWFAQIKSTKKTDNEQFLGSNYRLQWKVKIEKDANTNRNRYATVNLLSDGTMYVSCLWSIDADIPVNKIDFYDNVCVKNINRLVNKINSVSQAFRFNIPIEIGQTNMVLSKINCNIFIPVRFDFTELSRVFENHPFLTFFATIKKKKEGSNRATNYLKYQLVSFPSTFENIHANIDDPETIGIRITFQDSFQEGFSTITINGADSAQQVRYIYDFVLRITSIYVTGNKKTSKALAAIDTANMDLDALLNAVEEQRDKADDTVDIAVDDEHITSAAIQKKVKLTAADKKNIENFNKINNKDRIQQMYPSAQGALAYSRQCQKRRPTVYLGSEFRKKTAMTKKQIDEYLDLRKKYMQKKKLTNDEIDKLQLYNKNMYTYAIKYPNPRGIPQLDDVYMVCDRLGGGPTSTPIENIKKLANIYPSIIRKHDTPCCFTKPYDDMPDELWPNIIPAPDSSLMPKKKSYSATKDYVKQSIGVYKPNNYGILPPKLNVIFNNPKTIEAMIDKKKLKTEYPDKPFLQIGVVTHNSSIFLHSYFTALDTKYGERYRNLDFSEKAIKYVNKQRERIGDLLRGEKGKQVFAAIDKTLWEADMKVLDNFIAAVVADSDGKYRDLNEKYWWQLLSVVYGVQPILFSYQNENIVCTIRRDIQNVFNSENRFMFILKIEYSYQPIVWVVNKNDHIGVFEYSRRAYNIVGLIFRLYTYMCKDILISHNELLYPKDMLQKLDEAGVESVVGQVVQSAHIVFLVISYREKPILIPVVPGVPLDIPHTKLDKKVLTDASTLTRVWKKYKLGVSPMSQIVHDGKTVGLLVTGNIYVPCLPSDELDGVPTTSSVDVYKINRNVLKNNILASKYLEHVSQHQYEIELYQRLRYELSRYLIERVPKKRSELLDILNSHKPGNQKMEEIKKLLDPVLDRIIHTGKVPEYTVDNIPPVRSACFASTDCAGDIYCAKNESGKCRLFMDPRDLSVLRQRLYVELLHNDLRAEEIMEGYINIYNRDHINFDVDLGNIWENKEQVLQNLYGTSDMDVGSSDVSTFVTHFPKNDTLVEKALYDPNYILPYTSDDGKYVIQNVPVDENNLYKATTNAMYWIEAGHNKQPGYFGVKDKNKSVGATQDEHARKMRKQVYNFLKTQVKTKTELKPLIDKMIQRYHPYDNTMSYVRRIKFNAPGNEPSEIELWALATILGKNIHVFDQREGFEKPAKIFEPITGAAHRKDTIYLYYSKRNQYNVMYKK